MLNHLHANGIVALSLSTRLPTQRGSLVQLHTCRSYGLQLAWEFRSANWRWCGGSQGGARGINESLSQHLSVLTHSFLPPSFSYWSQWYFLLNSSPCFNLSHLWSATMQLINSPEFKACFSAMAGWHFSRDVTRRLLIDGCGQSHVSAKNGWNYLWEQFWA